MSEASHSVQMVPVIMAGGSGTRLWPVSRETMPKQFIELMGDGLSTFQTTLRRINSPAFAPPIVITSDEFRFIAAVQMQALGVAGEIVLEPERRDSAAAVAVGAAMAAERDPDAICLIMAADHVITDDEAFVADCRRAALAARSGRIMTIGIVPTSPSTAYGYIEPGDALETGDAYAVTRFVEKPDRARATDYVTRGMLWNSGNFLFQADVMLRELEEKQPLIVEAAQEAIAAGRRDLDFLRLDPEAFRTSPRISIDYAVMEKTARAGVVRATFGWSDIGSWDSLHEVKPTDGGGNVCEGPVELLETRGSLVRSDGPLTAVIGLEDVVVVATRDAVLVSAKAHAPKVKDLVAKLRHDGRTEATDHLRIHRPWGWYERIDIGDRFQVKHIMVKPDGTLSLQRHYHRAEHWVVVSGTAEVTIDGAIKLCHENEAVYLPIGCIHRLRNPGKIPLRLIEVQVGSYTGEDDIVRIEDIYARS